METGNAIMSSWQDLQNHGEIGSKDN